jgi:hypothetical protein
MSLKSMIFQRIAIALSLFSMAAVSTACGILAPNFPSDADMIEQWKGEKSQLLALIDECKVTKNTYSLPTLYDGDVTTGYMYIATGCKVELPSLKPEDAYALQYMARDSEGAQFLMATNRYESRVMRLWFRPILEGKGFLYTSGDNPSSLDQQFASTGQVFVEDKSLDSLVGKYGRKNDLTMNDACEGWMFRPIEPHWYLYYHQNGECGFEGL